MRKMGFELRFPAFGDEWDRLARWHRSQKDSAWVHQASGLVVELHSRLADNPVLIPSLGVDSPRQCVEVVAGITLPTLAWPEMFAHLCVHGASSAWFRLKWLSDLAALLSKSSEPVEALYDRSQQLGAGRCAAQALLLANRLFGIQIPGSLLRQLDSVRVNRWLADAARRQLLAPEPGTQRFGTARIHATQFFLMPSVRYKAGEARRQFAAAISNVFD
jgi:hypothetical protein